MTIKEAISARHMVRTYTDKPIPDDIVTKLNERIALMNDAHGVQMKLITGENAPVWGLMRLCSEELAGIACDIVSIEHRKQ